jgi:ElaB/YqjD/DUF883 family membrane-anchored ribosome-binding protein
MTPTQSLEQRNGSTASAPSSDVGSSTPPRAGDNAFDTLSTAVREMQHDAVPVLERATARAGDIAQRGIEAVRGSSRQLRDKALDASDRTVAYIKDEPVKAMLIAAATGAALMALLNLVSRSRHHG